MKAMDRMELLGVLPTCHFESLFGDLEQREMVLAGNHPRSQFYGEFFGVGKSGLAASSPGLFARSIPESL
ncbi:unnamed protein product [Brassica oleracea]